MRRENWLLGLIVVGVACAFVSWLAAQPAHAEADETQGAPSPSSAAHRLLTAFRAGDTERAVNLLSDDARLEWDSKMTPFLDAIEIEWFEVGEVQQEGNDKASVFYMWQCELNTRTYRDGVYARVRMEMELQGIDEAQIDRVLEAMRSDVILEANELRELLGHEQLEMALVRQADGRWYVADFARDPSAAAGGSATPDEAVRRMLEAWADPIANRDRMMGAFSEDAADHFFAGDGEALVNAFRVEQFEILASEVDRDVAEVHVRWRATLDTNVYVRTMLGIIQRDLTMEGVRGDELAEELRFAQEELERDASGVRSALERAEHTMILTRENRRWYVDQLIVDSTPDGTAEPDVAVYTLLDAIAFDDPMLARYVIAPTRRDEDMQRDGLAWVRALQVESSTPGELQLGEDGDTATVPVAWQAAFDKERYERATRNTQIERLRRQGIEGEELEQRLAETREAREAYAQHLQALAESDAVTLHLEKVNDRWYVARLSVAE